MLSLCAVGPETALLLWIWVKLGCPGGQSLVICLLPSRGCHLPAGSWQAWLHPRAAWPTGFHKHQDSRGEALPGGFPGLGEGCGLQCGILWGGSGGRFVPRLVLMVIVTYAAQRASPSPWCQPVGSNEDHVCCVLTGPTPPEASVPSKEHHRTV